MEQEITIDIPNDGTIRFYAFQKTRWVAFDADPKMENFGRWVGEQAKTAAYELTK